MARRKASSCVMASSHPGPSGRHIRWRAAAAGPPSGIRLHRHLPCGLRACGRAACIVLGAERPCEGEMVASPELGIPRPALAAMSDAGLSSRTAHRHLPCSEELPMDTSLFRVWLAGAALLLAGGATRADEKATAPEVPVATPLVREVTDSEDFASRTEASARVEVRARVTGYLDRVLFRDGAEVKRGDPL